MRNRTFHERLRALDRPLGGSRLTLLLGNRRIALEGLDAELTASLERRWGRFVVAGSGAAPRCSARLFRAGETPWLTRRSHGEAYRVEARGHERARVVVSYHFGIGRGAGAAEWKLGITERTEEPRDRLVENAVRFIAAHLALDEGGFAMHAAGVLRGERAYLFAGPSRAGKSTASKLVAGAESLGDDFGMIVHDEAGWRTPALPFDNSEHVLDRPSSGLYPVAGVWRLNRATETRTEPGVGLRATAALTGCAAFAWAMPERGEQLLTHVRRFVEQGLFHQLYFTPDADLWPHLARSAGD